MIVRDLENKVACVLGTMYRVVAMGLKYAMNPIPRIVH